MNKLEEISGGGKGAGDIYASAISGAAQGVMMCMQTGVAVQPLVMFGCAGAGAALSLIFPQ